MKLDNYMKNRGLKIGDFATEIGVPHVTVWRWLKGERFPEPNMIRRVMKATDGLVMPNDWYD